MTDTCTCPPDDCHGGHTINVGPARPDEDRLRTFVKYGRDAEPDEVSAMAAELLALRPRVTQLEADQAVANKALDEIAGYVQPDEDGMWTDADGLLESIGNTVESTGRKVWEESHG